MQFSITPVVWILLLLVYALFSKIASRKRKALITALVMLYLFSNPFIFNQIMGLWEIPATSQKKLPVYDAGIVLGGMASIDNRLDRIQFSRSTDRLLQAVDLFKKGYIKKIVFTGGSGSITFPENKEGIFIKTYLQTLQIPDSCLIIEHESKNTHENALFTKPLLQQNKLLEPEKKLLLITSAFHMRRSLGCFEKVGITTTPYSTDRHSGYHPVDIDYLLIPNSEILDHWTLLIHEVVGYITYKISGYI